MNVITFMRKIDKVLTTADKRYLFYFFFFTIVITFVEIVGISAIIPFLSMIIDPTLLESNKYYQYFYNLFGAKDKNIFILLSAFCLFIFYLLRFILNSLYIFITVYFMNSRYNNIANRMFQKYLTLSYEKFTNLNGSALTKVIISEVANLTQLFWFVMIFVSEIFVFLAIYLILLYLDYKIIIGITILILFLMIFMKFIVSKRMKCYGIKREEYQKRIYEIMNRSFNNIKMLKLTSNSTYFRDFGSDTKNQENIAIRSGILQEIIKPTFEFIIFSLILIIIVYAYRNFNSNEIFLFISAFSLGLIRVIPSVTKIYSSYHSILFLHRSLDIVYNDLNLFSENLGNEKILFNKQIKLKDITFEYKQNRPVFKKVNLTINKGEKVAFVGKSGGGKSTLIDIIVGLYKSTNGSITVDDQILEDKNIKNWRTHFGYIPQSTYLFDGSVADNVVFQRDYDVNQINKVLKQAKIYDFLQTKDGINTIVGEGGIMLSGGQKQRIAIARALYDNPEILVLDEATSALDNETESKIMNEIYSISSDKTLIIIAHRLSTIKRCEKIYEIDNGVILNI